VRRKGDFIILSPVPPVPVPPVPPAAGATTIEVEGDILGDLLLTLLTLANRLQESRANLDGILLTAESVEANVGAGANPIILGGVGGSALVTSSFIMRQAFQREGALVSEITIPRAGQLGATKVSRHLGGTIGETAVVEDRVTIAARGHHPLRARGQ
jgi:hypothetical protein